MGMKWQQNGFTLIELMVVVAVVAILATIALPAYQDSVRKARRADGRAALSGLEQAQEQFRANCRFYAGALATADLCASDAASSTLNYPTRSDEGHYTIAITDGTASGNAYTITATATGAQTSDTDCRVLTVTVATSGKTRTPDDCWP